MRQNGALPAFHRNAAIRKVAVSTTARTVNGQRRRAASGRLAANASTTSQAFGVAKSYAADAGLVATLLTTSADNAAASSESTSQSLVHRPSAVGSRATDASILDRKSTRLNSSHPSISYAVFCLKKKKT